MNIQIDKDWRVRSDEHQYILEYLTKPKKGVGRGGNWWVHGYYPTLGMALETYLEVRERGSDASTLKEVSALIIELKSLKTALSHLKQQYDS